MGAMETKRIGSWQLGRFLGAGGMGTVYEAVNVKTNERAAFKILLQDRESSHDGLTAARRLKDEARATVGIKHAGLVRVLDSGEDEDMGPYVVYEFISGKSLRQYLKLRRKIPLKEAMGKLIEPLLGALAALHEKGVVHRDVKPDNLFQTKDGTFKLGDLGLAVFDGREAQTKTGVIVGTPGYLAPEQLLDPEEVPTPALDCYAAAVLIVEVLTGACPFGRGSLANTIKNQLEKPLAIKELQSKGIPSELAPILAKALNKDKNARFEKACTFLECLKEAVSGVKSVAVTQQVALSNVAKPESNVGMGRRQVFVGIILLFIGSVLVFVLSNKSKVPDYSKKQLLFFARAKAMNARSSLPSAVKFNELLDLAAEFGHLITPKLRREWPKAIADIGPHNYLGLACKGARLAGLGKKDRAYKYLSHSLWLLRRAFKKKEPYFVNSHEIEVALVFRCFDVQVDCEKQIDIVKEAMRCQKRYSPQVQLGYWGATMRLQFLLLLARVKENSSTDAAKVELADMESALALCRPFEEKIRRGMPLDGGDLKVISSSFEQLREVGQGLSLSAVLEAKRVSDLAKKLTQRMLMAKIQEADASAHKMTSFVKEQLPRVWKTISEHRKSCWTFYTIILAPNCEPHDLARACLMFLRTLNTRRARFEAFKSLFTELKDWGPVFTVKGCTEQAEETVRRLIVWRNSIEDQPVELKWMLESALVEAGVDFVVSVHRYCSSYDMKLLDNLAQMKVPSPAKHAILAAHWSLKGEREKSLIEAKRASRLLVKSLKQVRPCPEKARSILRCYKAIWIANRRCRRSSANVQLALAVLEWMDEAEIGQVMEKSEFNQLRVQTALYAIDGQQYSQERKWDRSRLQSIIEGYKGSDGETKIWIADVLAGKRRPQEK